MKNTYYCPLKVKLQETIGNDDFLRATQRFKVGKMLQPFETTSQQSCNALKIVMARCHLKCLPKMHR